MAEFCLKCFNKMNDTEYTEKQVWLEDDLCEGCAEIKPCIIALHPKPLIYHIIDFFKTK